MRRGKPENRIIPPDIRHNSVAVQTLVQHMMVRGKKSTATRIMYDTLDIIADKTGKNPMETFDMALKNVGPLMEVRPRRVGGATRVSDRGDQRDSADRGDGGARPSALRTPVSPRGRAH